VRAAAAAGKVAAAAAAAAAGKVAAAAAAAAAGRVAAAAAGRVAAAAAAGTAAVAAAVVAAAIPAGKEPGGMGLLRCLAVAKLKTGRPGTGRRAIYEAVVEGHGRPRREAARSAASWRDLPRRYPAVYLCSARGENFPILWGQGPRCAV
jgi:hypothetical protein